MELNDLQRRVAETAIYPDENQVIYPVALLVEEAGETQRILNKQMRREPVPFVVSPENRERLLEELEDVLWAVVQGITDLGVTLEDAAAHLLYRLNQRASAGLIDGEGHGEDRYRGA